MTGQTLCPEHSTQHGCCQSAVVLLECVPGALNDSAFQEVLKRFVSLTGFRLCQTILRLSDSWCSRRDRWFGVLSAPIFGSFGFAAYAAIRSVSQGVLPFS